jgi:mono/diheme cytochrome c family protein
MSVLHSTGRRELPRLGAVVGLCLVSWLASAQQGRMKNAAVESDYAQLTKAPLKVRARCNPFGDDRLAVAAGRKLFLQHCAECHGNDADGTNKAPSLRAEEVQQSTAGTLFWVLTNGVVRRGMPVWSKLPEPQRWQIISYIKSLPATPKVTSKNETTNAAVHE